MQIPSITSANKSHPALLALGLLVIFAMIGCGFLATSDSHPGLGLYILAGISSGITGCCLVMMLLNPRG